MKLKPILVWTFASAMVAAAGPGRAEDAPQPAPVRKLHGNTLPSEKAEMTLSSRTSDVVWEIMVKKGDVVKPGQVLASGDIREEQAELRGIELLAKSDTAIRAAEVTKEHRQLKLDRMSKGGDNFSPFERLEAKLDLDLAGLDIEKATLERERAVAQADALRARIAAKQLVSRIGGIVREINIEKGGVIDPQKPAMVIVRNDPLWVDVSLPVETSLALMKLQRANKNVEFGVLYPGAKEPIPARVIFFDPVADPVGHSQLVTLELKNDEQLPAGLEVEIIVPNMEKVAGANVK